MEPRLKIGAFWRLALAFMLVGPGLVNAGESRRLVKLDAGEEASAWGTTVKASKPSVLLITLSSEFATVAVLDGEISQGRHKGQAGDALVTPLDSGKTRVLKFDARRLAATLPQEWLVDARASLDAVAARQVKQRYWGLIEPVNLNANAPVAPAMEAVRTSYLGNDTIAALRREAKGNPQTLAALTAKRFAAALASRDAATVASLIDPKPFTDTGAEAEAWQAARNAFATKLTADAALTGAMATEPAAVADDQAAFDAGSYRIRLVPRDRALFVAAVEMQK